MIRMLKSLIPGLRNPKAEPVKPAQAGNRQPLSRMTRIGLLGAHIGQAGGLRGKTR